jgi:hypothetical protein
VLALELTVSDFELFEVVLLQKVKVVDWRVVVTHFLDLIEFLLELTVSDFELFEVVLLQKVKVVDWRVVVTHFPVEH